MKMFWSNVWARIIAHRIKDPTWQATFTLPADCENNQCFNIAKMDYVKTREDDAYGVFYDHFTRLRPDLQIALSGATADAWNKRDMATRYHPSKLNAEI